MRMRGRFCESGTRCFVLLATALRGAVRVARGGFVELFRRVPPLVSDSRETTHACLLVTREMATTTTQTTTGLLLCVFLPVFLISKSRLDAPKNHQAGSGPAQRDFPCPSPPFLGLVLGVLNPICPKPN